MDFKIGDMVKLNTKTYKIVDTHKRSWILESNGKKYKATSNMMNKIKDQNKKGIGTGKRTRRPKISFLEGEERMRKIFMGENYKPMTMKEKFEKMACALSPENLTCDGELSRTAVMSKLASIRRDWKACEKEIGKRVSEEDVW